MKKIKIINKSKFGLPLHATMGSAGVDLRADFSTEPNSLNSIFINNELRLLPGSRALVFTNLFMEIPVGYELQIRPRSGLAIKHGITVLNSPGTIDSDYRGNIGIIIINHGGRDYIVKDGDKIAQGVLVKHEHILYEEVDELSETIRNSGGFGHTGI